MDIGISNPLAPMASRSTVAAVPVTPVAGLGKAIAGELEPKSLVAVADVKDSREPVEQAVTSIQTFVQNIRRDLNFSLDDSSGRVVVKVTDSSSGEVIRQLPSEEALRLAESLEEVRSLLFQAEA